MAEQKNTLNIYIERTTVIESWNKSGNLYSDCNAICFYNIGNKTCFINNTLPVEPKQSFTISGNVGEWDKSQYTVRFDTTDTNPLLLTIRSLYR